MKTFLTRLSRRERLYLLVAAAALFAGGVLYPVSRAAGAHRRETLEALEAARALNAGYLHMLRTAEQIRSENEELKESLDRTDGLLFDRVGNDVMMEAWVVRLLNQMAPDMGLEISRARTSLRDPPGVMKFTLRGSGRYPEILNFFYQLETHRPLIVINQFNIAIQGARRPSGQRGGQGGSQQQRSRAPQETELTEPRMRLQMEIQLHCRTAEERK
jgi:hypothetical protein